MVPLVTRFALVVGVSEIGSPTVDVFVLGTELLCGEGAELERAGVGGASMASRGMEGESMRSE
jgi:hypothetical protein